METSRTVNRSLTRTLRPTAGQRVRAALGIVSPLAWVLGVVAIVAMVLGRRYGWVELTILAVAIVVLLLISVGFTFGQDEVQVAVEVKPRRVQAGDHSAALITVRHPSGGRLLPVGMELVVGDGVAEFHVPFVGSGDAHEEVFLLPTHRRAVIPVGPATSVRSDPLGLLRRTRTWTEVLPLFVHPRLVSLRELGTGFLRDLEGTATDQLSDADVAFHTLREYQPGDDRRFIHWMTTARLGKYMVRQFVDTRRSHVAVVVDGTEAAYPDEDHFEVAVSVAGSLGVRVLRSEQEVSLVVSGDRIPSGVPSELLDGLAAVVRGNRNAGLVAEVHHLFRFAAGLSLAVLVTGPATSFRELRAAASQFPPDVRVLLVRVDLDGDEAVQPLADHVLITLPSLDALGPLLWKAAG